MRSIWISPNKLSQTKVNRCLAEGRERFRAFLSRSESGDRCEELRPLLSAFCDGEAGPQDAAVLREHLRACAHCRATMRAYRAAPRALAALGPLPFASRSLFERAHEALLGLYSRLPGQRGGGESAATQVAASGGARGAGMAGLAKLLAVCAGAAGGAAACVGAGVVPAPFDLAPDHLAPPRAEQSASAVPSTPVATPEPEATVLPEAPEHQANTPGREGPPTDPPETAEPVEDGAVEYSPPVTAQSAPAPAATSTQDSAAGEFGP